MPWFSDRFGRRKAIIVSIFGSLLGFAGQALSYSFGMLVAVRALGGLFGGTSTVASAFIVDLYPLKERPKQFAKLGAGSMSAFIFGPFVGGGLAQFGLRVPLWTATGLSFSAMVAAIYFVHDTSDLCLPAKKDDDHAAGSGGGGSNNHSKGSVGDIESDGKSSSGGGDTSAAVAKRPRAKSGSGTKKYLEMEEDDPVASACLLFFGTAAAASCERT